MKQPRSGIARRPVPDIVAFHLLLSLAVATLAILSGCASAGASVESGAIRSGRALARVRDSLAMRGSVDLGYMRQSRGNITGSVATLPLAEQSTRVQVRSLADLLQGRIAGLNARATSAGGVSLQIRGADGGFGGGEPLVIVDGNPLPSGIGLQSFLGSIDASEVVRVDVLKDVSATAVFGTRGNNGVVLITLRHATQ